MTTFNNKIGIIFIALFTIFAVCFTSACSQGGKSDDLATKYSEQIITVAVDSEDSTYAEITMKGKTSGGGWETILTTPGRVGKNGIGKEKEGDGKTPTGIYSLNEAFGIYDNPGTMLDYLKVDDTYFWVDDPNSQYYNKLVSTKNVKKDWNSAENIVKTGEAYGYVIAIGYNTEERTPGLGSAIFLHCMTSSATAGCVSVPEDRMVSILNSINENCQIYIDTTDNIKKSEYGK